ncbi:unnamed protein product [Bacillus thuringiensis DB27]|uniref:Uncharacterized protein n=1 Tax=Bacillus thuringiensis DB27 TaxID=1431339 RepID=W8YA61_BACTU|nr:unnamed protein product [Bacillus thuringiensis DB27]
MFQRCLNMRISSDEVQGVRIVRDFSYILFYVKVYIEKRKASIAGAFTVLR